MQLTSQNSGQYYSTQINIFSLPGLLFVLAIHGALFYGLWKQEMIPPPEQMVTLFADFVSAPMPEKTSTARLEPAEIKPQPIKKPEVKPQPRLVSKTPALPKEQIVAAPPVSETALEPEAESIPEPIVVAQPSQMPNGPVTLTSELSVSCPKLNAPSYPSHSRRLGEEGKLVLRVELDTDGQIDTAEVINSSGHARLDNAALTAVKSWQCESPIRDGYTVRAVALQPFNFVLQGNN